MYYTLDAMYHICVATACPVTESYWAQQQFGSHTQKQTL